MQVQNLLAKPTLWAAESTHHVLKAGSSSAKASLTSCNFAKDGLCQWTAAAAAGLTKVVQGTFWVEGRPGSGRRKLHDKALAQHSDVQQLVRPVLKGSTPLARHKLLRAVRRIYACSAYRNTGRARRRCSLLLVKMHT